MVVGATDLTPINFTSTASGACANGLSKKAHSLPDDRYFPSPPVRPAGCSAPSQHSIEDTWRRLICSRCAAAAAHRAADELGAAKLADRTQE